MIEAHPEERTEAIRVLIASDLRLFREGLEQMLRCSSGIEVLPGVADAADAIERAHALAPAVVLLDLSMPEAFSIVRELTRTARGSKVVALGMPEIEAEIITCAAAGVAGYVTRSGTLGDALEAIRAAARGEVRCSPKAAGFLFRHIANIAGERGSGPDGGLTTRERQILQLLQQGLTNKAISRNLGIELATVKNHLHSIFSKLGVHRRAEAVSLLQRNGASLSGALLAPTPRPNGRV